MILTGELKDWPALTRWTPDYLAAAVGDRIVEFQDGRDGSPHFERDKARHRVSAPFASFIDRIRNAGDSNDTYLTAYNSAVNTDALAPLVADMGLLTTFLAATREQPGGMLWIGPAGTFTPLHHDLTNNLIAQIVGRKRIKLLPAAEVGQLYNDAGVFSEITDLDQPLDPARFAKLEGVRVYDIVLQPGELLFVPLAWWHQVKALEFSVTATYTNFHWPNDAAQSYPAK